MRHSHPSQHGRSEELCCAFENYYKAQGMWGIPLQGKVDYSVDIDIDLTTVVPSVAGPKRPQDRINLPDLGATFRSLFAKSAAEGGFGQSIDNIGRSVQVHINGARVGHDHSLPEGRNGEPMDAAEMIGNRPTPDAPEGYLSSAFYKPGDARLGHGSVLIAAITSCTNTSNPSVMLASGLLAKKAVEFGLHVGPAVKTSLAPGSRVVTDYLNKTGLQKYLDALGFQTVGYGCTTCIGNLAPSIRIEEAIVKNDLITAAVLSGNRNFEARIHQNIKANFLMSPPLVVAFALPDEWISI